MWILGWSTLQAWQILLALISEASKTTQHYSLEIWQNTHTHAHKLTHMSKVINLALCCPSWLTCFVWKAQLRHSNASTIEQQPKLQLGELCQDANRVWAGVHNNSRAFLIACQMVLRLSEWRLLTGYNRQILTLLYGVRKDRGETLQFDRVKG